MSEFKFSCPNCGQHLRVEMDAAGLQYQCPACRTDFLIPNPKSATSLRLESERWIPPPTDAHSAPAARATIPLPPPPPAQTPPPEARLDTLAVVSVVFALLPLIGSVPAILCGHWALREIARSTHLTGRNLATLGLILGYTSLALTVTVGVWWLARTR